MKKETKIQILDNLFEGHTCNNCILKYANWCNKHPHHSTCKDWHGANNERIYTMKIWQKAYLELYDKTKDEMEHPE